jgi:hypothetical protein
VNRYVQTVQRITQPGESQSLNAQRIDLPTNLHDLDLDSEDGEPELVLAGFSHPNIYR